MPTKIAFTVFTKHWKMPLAEMAERIAALGFEGVELPVRPGFQVAPENVTSGLPAAARILGDFGLKIGSVAGPTDEPTIAACAAAGVPLIRICCHVPEGRDYLQWEAEQQRTFDGLLPCLDAAGVAIGVQNHCDREITAAMGLRHLIEKYDPRHVGAVLDFGHSGLAGEPPDLALGAVFSHLRLVNFKSAYWKRVTGPQADRARWTQHWTTGREGLADWPAAVEELTRRGYAGDVCLSADYSDAQATERLTAEDLATVKSLFA